MVHIEIVAQNFDIFEGDGLDLFARTGKTSLNQILRAGAQGVILGHSEVGDTPETVNKKLLSILKKQQELKDCSFLRVIVLVGESWDEFDKNTPQKIAQLMKAKCSVIFKDVPGQFLSQIIICYEPKWGSKGSGRDDMPPPQPELIFSCIAEMKAFFKEKYGDGIPYFIYGGRSTPERTREILGGENIGGLILGSACNTVEKTLAIAKVMQEICVGKKKVLICNFKAYDLPDSYEKYISELEKLPEDFVILLAPPYTDIGLVRDIIETKL